MRENLVFVKIIHIFFLKCNFSNSFATFEQSYIVSDITAKYEQGSITKYKIMSDGKLILD